MYGAFIGIYSIQYIIMWCLALMENQWWDKPATAETIQKQFPNWHVEGLCDWFWLLLDFNTVHVELIDSQTSSCGLSTNWQMSPCLRFLRLHFFFFCFCLGRNRESECAVFEIFDKWEDDFKPMLPLCNQSQPYIAVYSG